MPPRGVKSQKRKRQYEHIKESEEERGNPRAEEIAARTVNKQRAQAGETKSARGRKKTGAAKKSSSAKKSGGKKKSASSARSRSSSRKSSSGSAKTKRAAKKR